MKYILLSVGLILCNSVFAQAILHQIDLDSPSVFQKFNIEHLGIVYEKRLNFSEGLVLIYIPSRKVFAYMDAHANVIIPTQYNEYQWFSEGLAPVRKGKKWGYINPTMQLVVPFIYDKVELFREGKAIVWQSGKKRELYKSEISY
jgi:hypothetical protein